MKFEKIKAIFGLGMTPVYDLKNSQIKSLPVLVKSWSGLVNSGSW